MAGQRILMMVKGTRGDAQPFVPLAAALQDAGFTVKVFCPPDHVPLFQQVNVDTWASGVSVTKIMQEDEGMRGAMEKGSLITYIKALSKIMEDLASKWLPLTLQEMRSFKPDLITYGVLDLWGVPTVAHAWGIPCIPITLQAGAPTQDLTSFFGEPDWLPRRVHLALHMLGQKLRSMGDFKRLYLYDKYVPEAKSWTCDVEQHMLANIYYTPARPICLVSPSLFHRMSDWPADYDPLFAGSSVVQEATQVKLMNEGHAEYGGPERDRLEAFLAKGKPPVYMGWGSMLSVSAEHMARLAVRTLMSLGERGVVLGGIAQLKEEMLDGEPDSAEMRAYVDANVLFVQMAPHEMLFQRCSAIVHHGGAGTMAAALRSGAPSVITPIWLDQYFHGQVVEANEVGIHTQHFGKLSVKDLTAAVTRCLTDKALREKARLLSVKLRAEDGPATAVTEIKRFMDEDVASGKYAAKVAERRQQLDIIAKRGSPSCFAWMWRIFCSKEPNNYWVPLPEKSKGA